MLVALGISDNHGAIVMSDGFHNINAGVQCNGAVTTTGI